MNCLYRYNVYCIIFLFILLASLLVTITSNASSVVCVKSTITLTCQATGATQFKWTTSDHSEVINNNRNTITVTATNKHIQYMCTATDDKGSSGTSYSVVYSNGKLCNSNQYA